MNKFARFITPARVALASMGTMVASARAEVPAEVTTALTGLKTDGMAAATLVLLAIVAIFAIKFIRKGL